MAAKLSEDWQGKKSLVDCNRYMLENNIADVTFSITHSVKGERSPPVQIRALKTLLLARSSVFYAMFCGELQEQSQIIEVTDVEPGAFKELLRYMYTDEVNLTADNVLSVLYASKKYMVSTLSDLCAKYLEESLTSETAPTLLDQSIFFDMTELIPKCMEKIQSEASTVLASDTFTNLSPEALQMILKSETLNSTELEVFNASIIWAENQCKTQGKKSTAANIRASLGDNLFLIRFTTMTLDEFNENVDTREILSESEAYLVLKYLTAKTPPKNLPFITRHRNPMKKYVAAGKVACGNIEYLIKPKVKIDYHSNSKLQTTIKCTSSQSVQLHSVLIATLNGLQDCSHILSLVIKQSGRMLFQVQNRDMKSGIIKGEHDHCAFQLRNVIIRTGDFAIEVNLKVLAVDCLFRMHVSSPDVTCMTDGNITITGLTGNNLLHGLKYSIID